MKGVFYSNGPFDKEKLKSIKNFPGHNKPSGGLWLTPLNSMTFQEWWKNEMDDYWGNFKTVIEVSGKALIVKDSSFAEWLSTHKEYTNGTFFGFYYLNFETLAKDFDYIVYKHNAETRDILPGWDLDSILCLNIDKIKFISSEATLV